MHFNCPGLNNDYQTSINDYTIINSIGKGCRSNLFKVQENSSHDIYAMKILSRKNKEYDHNNIKILSSLNHPNIMKIYDMFDIKNNQNEEFLVVITDYCENGNLIDHSTKYGFKNEIEKKKISLHLLEAIRYLHKHGIAHGNIRPENILLDRNLTPKLFNFKNDKISDINKNNETSFFKADIWSFGVTLYEAFELCFPFKNVEDVLNDRISFVKSFKDKNLKKLIFECIRRNPEFRPTADNLMKEEYFMNMNKHTEKKNNQKIKRSNDCLKKKVAKERDFYFSVKNLI